jgi:hypothetical protein
MVSLGYVDPGNCAADLAEGVLASDDGMGVTFELYRRRNSRLGGKRLQYPPPSPDDVSRSRERRIASSMYRAK